MTEKLLSTPKRTLFHVILTREWRTTREVADRYYAAEQVPYRVRQSVSKHLVALANMGLIERKKGVAYTEVQGKTTPELRETSFWRLPPE